MFSFILQGLFEKSVGQVSAKYSLYITPAGWTFGIWGFIYICLSATISYCKHALKFSSNIILAVIDLFFHGFFLILFSSSSLCSCSHFLANKCIRRVDGIPHQRERMPGLRRSDYPFAALLRVTHL